jgi:LmbE family N-acetylglucosaminyl deacetylase
MTITDAAELGTILGVWAHPDDETYLSAGTMAAGIAAGNRVGCITATRGELGSQDPVRWPLETMGEVREREMDASLAVIGVTEHWWLDLPDGGCAAVDPEEGASRVAQIMEQLQPDTVLTFAPDGMTGHEDHIAVSGWAVEALARVGKPGAALYFAATSPAWAERFVPLMEPHNVFMVPGTPVITPLEQMAIAVPIEGALLDLKARAIGEHVSQIEGLRAALGEDNWMESLLDEPYRLGARAD